MARLNGGELLIDLSELVPDLSTIESDFTLEDYSLPNVFLNTLNKSPKFRFKASGKLIEIEIPLDSVKSYGDSQNIFRYATKTYNANEDVRNLKIDLVIESNPLISIYIEE